MKKRNKNHLNYLTPYFANEIFKKVRDFYECLFFMSASEEMIDETIEKINNAIIMGFNLLEIDMASLHNAEKWELEAYYRGIQPFFVVISECIRLLKFFGQYSWMVKWWQEIMAKFIAGMGNFIFFRQIRSVSMFDFTRRFVYYRINKFSISESETAEFIFNQALFYKTLSAKRLNLLSSPTSFGKTTLLLYKIISLFKEETLIILMEPNDAIVDECLLKLKDLQKRAYKKFLINPETFPEEPSNIIYCLTQEKTLLLLLNYPELCVSHVFVDEASGLFKNFADRRSLLLLKVTDLLLDNQLHATFNFIMPNIYLDALNFFKEWRKDFANVELLSCCSESTSLTANTLYLLELNRKGVSLYAYDREMNDLILHIENMKLAEWMKYENKIERIINNERHLKRVNHLVYFIRKNRLITEQILIYTTYESIFFISLYLQNCLEDILPIDGGESNRDIIDYIRNNIYGDYMLIGLLKNKIAYYYGDMDDELKRMIIVNYNKGLINTLLCSKALINGINLSCCYLFLLSLKTSNLTPMQNPVDLLNLIGRVGRFDLKPYGTVIVISEDFKKDALIIKSIYADRTKTIPTIKNLFTGLNRSKSQIIHRGWNLYCNDPEDSASKIKTKMINEHLVNKCSFKIAIPDSYDYLCNHNVNDVERIGKYIGKKLKKALVTLLDYTEMKFDFNDLWIVNESKINITTSAYSAEQRLLLNDARIVEKHNEFIINLAELVGVLYGENVQLDNLNVLFRKYYTKLKMYSDFAIKKMRFAEWIRRKLYSYQAANTNLIEFLNRFNQDVLHNDIFLLQNDAAIKKNFLEKLEAGYMVKEKHYDYGLVMVTYLNINKIVRLSEKRLHKFILNNYMHIFDFNKSFDLSVYININDDFDENETEVYDSNDNFGKQSYVYRNNSVYASLVIDYWKKYLNEKIANDLQNRIANFLHKSSEKASKSQNLAKMLNKIKNVFDDAS